MPESLPVRQHEFVEECGIMAVWNVPEAANLSYLGLYAQQHRGQEGAGVVSLEPEGEGQFRSHKGLGLVSDVFKRFDFDSLPGTCALGHVRYTTAGESVLQNVQPFLAEVSLGKVAIAHNGNLTNAVTLRKELIRKGAIFATTSDSEVLLHLLAKSPGNQPVRERVLDSLTKLEGAFSFVVMLGDRLYCARDARGIRPLLLGKLGDGYVAASESCAFDLIGAEFEREIEPGEVLEIAREGAMTSYFPFERVSPAPCIFEYVYFARPDSFLFGNDVYGIRKQLGVELAKESEVEADMVVPVPDSGVTAAIGYSQESGLPLELGLIRNHYVGRTFIEPMQSIRNFGVKIKLNANSRVLQGKRIVVVDDSLVRGTTSKKIVAMLRKAGASEIHLRISAPPITHPCFYGIDTPEKEQLIASSKETEQIREFIGVDSLAYLSRKGLFRASKSEIGSMCDACFSGDYPVKIRPRETSTQSALNLK